MVRTSNKTAAFTA